MVSIAISFFIMILAVSISGGFRHELRQGLSELSGDIRLTGQNMNIAGESDALALDAPFMASIDSVEGISRVLPVVYRAGIVKNGDQIAGALFKGTPEGGDSLRVRIPSQMAQTLGLSEGDALLSYFVGERVKARKFTIEKVYPSLISEDENLVVYAGLSDLQRLNGWDSTQVSAVEISLRDKSSSNIKEKTEEIGTRVLLSSEGEFSAPLASSALQLYPRIFSWLDLIDVNVLFILVLMTIVAGFNMVSGLLIMLFRHISTIGILKAMGMTDRAISRVFLRVASGIVLKGLAAGNAAALLLCALQGMTHFITLNPENYFISFMPVHINVPLILAADVAAYFVIMVLLLLPSLFVSRVDPAKTVRAQ